MMMMIFTAKSMKKKSVGKSLPSSNYPSSFMAFGYANPSAEQKRPLSCRLPSLISIVSTSRTHTHTSHTKLMFPYLFSKFTVITAREIHFIFGWRLHISHSYSHLQTVIRHCHCLSWRLYTHPPNSSCVRAVFGRMSIPNGCKIDTLGIYFITIVMGQRIWCWLHVWTQSTAIATHFTFSIPNWIECKAFWVFFLKRGMQCQRWCTTKAVLVHFDRVYFLLFENEALCAIVVIEMLWWCTPASVHTLAI